MFHPNLVRLLVREHLYKPIKGKVLNLGYQTIGLSYEQVLELFQQEGYIVPEQVLKETVIEYDTTTLAALDLKKRGVNCITDKTFFSLFGVKDAVAMDVTDYEGAEILHDLNKPVPDSLVGQFDFIVDGGTFDHLFNLPTVFDNVLKLLKPGGRIFQWNAASNLTGAAFISFGPDLFYDYYVLNRYADCKVYLAECDSPADRAWDFFEFDGTDRHGYFPSSKILMVIVLAEKGLSSTSDKIPVQSHYRDEKLWETYRTAQQTIKKSTRKSWSGTPTGYFLSSVKDTQSESLNNLFSILPKTLKEKGLIYCIKAGTRILLTKRLYNCCSRFQKYLARIAGITTTRKVGGFNYVGKI